MQDKQLGLLAQNVGQMEARLKRLEDSFEALIKQVDERLKTIDGIDQVAFMSMYMRVNDSEPGAKITKKNVQATHDAIAKGFKQLEAYREKLVKEAEKQDADKKSKQKSN